MSVLTIILVIIVIIILFTYFYNLYQSYRRNKRRYESWPPKPHNVCPDYWIDEGNGMCSNPLSLGTGLPSNTGKKSQVPIRQQDFSSYGSCAGQKSWSKECRKAKCKWAKITNNPWFGVGPHCNSKNGNDCYCPE